MHTWNTFGACTSHGHTWTHKTHHGPDLGEATTFPLIVFYVIAHGVTPKCHFSRDFQVKSLEIFEIWTSIILDAHNFFCKPSIEMMFEAKL
jgi:hypothetical protein